MLSDSFGSAFGRPATAVALTSDLSGETGDRIRNVKFLRKFPVVPVIQLPMIALGYLRILHGNAVRDRFHIE